MPRRAQLHKRLQTVVPLTIRQMSQCPEGRSCIKDIILTKTTKIVVIWSQCPEGRSCIKDKDIFNRTNVLPFESQCPEGRSCIKDVIEALLQYKVANPIVAMPRRAQLHKRQGEYWLCTRW